MHPVKITYISVVRELAVRMVKKDIHFTMPSVTSVVDSFITPRTAEHKQRGKRRYENMSFSLTSLKWLLRFQIVIMFNFE